MFYILFLKLYQIYLNISSANHYLVKKGEFPPKVKISPRRMVFMKGVEEYIKFTSKKEEKDIPQKTVLQNGFKLGQWVSKTRTKKKKGKLSSNKLYDVFYEKILSNHGFIWQSENLLIGKTSSNN